MADPVEALEAVEARLLHTIERDPHDTHARQVYADWLEERGYPVRATFLRLDAVDDTPIEALAAAAMPLDAAWRAEVSRVAVSRCVTFAFACTKRWSDLRRQGGQYVRFCDQCGSSVMFVKSIEEARERGGAKQCIAIDPAVARGDAERAYDLADRRVQPMLGMIAPYRPLPDADADGADGDGDIYPPLPPVPPEVAPKPGLLGKIRGWFGK